MKLIESTIMSFSSHNNSIVSIVFLATALSATSAPNTAAPEVASRLYEYLFYAFLASFLATAIALGLLIFFYLRRNPRLDPTMPSVC